MSGKDGDTDIHMGRDFILTYIDNTVKTNEIQFMWFPGKSDLFGKKSCTTTCLI